MQNNNATYKAINEIVDKLKTDPEFSQETIVKLNIVEAVVASMKIHNNAVTRQNIVDYLCLKFQGGIPAEHIKDLFDHFINTLIQTEELIIKQDDRYYPTPQGLAIGTIKLSLDSVNENNSNN